MKKNIAILTVVLSFFLLSFEGKVDTYAIDAKACKVHWLGKKTGGQHEGNVSLKSGSLKVNGVEPVTAEFVLDMTTITCTDIKDPDDNKSLVGHLKKDDFFGVEKFPEASMSVTKFEKITDAKAGAPNYNATANLTIKGIKNEIKFPVTYDLKGAKVKANANITIDRTKWNITNGSKTIFASLGDKFIYDDIAFTVNLSLNKQK